jgi:alkylation response protein AidB-like acyl-CoA dehydrogenase
MALVLNEEQLMLKDSASGFLAEHAPVESLRKLRDDRDETGYSTEVWRQMAELGWAGIAIDEEYGGLGYGYTGLGVVLEEVGRKLSASPLEATVLTAATAIQIGGNDQQKQDLLPTIAAGETLVSLALQEGPQHRPTHIETTASTSGSGFEISGRKVMVLDAHVANTFIVVARTSGCADEEAGISLFLVAASAPGVSVETVVMTDSRNAGILTLDKVAVSSDALLGGLDEGYATLSRTLDIANIGLSAELLGISLEAYERTLVYLRERKQFGALIGSFQALQHRAAEMFAELELARSLVLKSLHAIDQDADNLPLLASACKAKLCEVVTRITNESVQMHGGIGMTDEFEIGFFLKRARVAQYTFGDYHYHLDRFAVLSSY